jgi:hypothetical protein
MPMVTIPDSTETAARDLMNSSDDPVVRQLNDLVRAEPASTVIRTTLARVVEELAASSQVMAWDVVPLESFGGELPVAIRSCWIFVIRPGAKTTAERHPNSHQRSLSLTGTGTFEVRERNAWEPHALVSDAAGGDQRWVTIPPSTWHRLSAGSEPWGMVSFHTVAAPELIEEKPLRDDDLDGETRQERYAG